MIKDFFLCVSLTTAYEWEAWSLVFVFKIISTFIGQNPKILFYACVDEGCFTSLTIAYERQT